jgi:predicted GIY-YIG superfamily endonuclease
MPFEALAKKGCRVHYVYLLQSEQVASERYIGVTNDLRNRLREHNAGKSAHTAKFKPWRVTTYVAFSDRGKAEAFERYLKSGSGHAFAKKRLWT